MAFQMVFCAFRKNIFHVFSLKRGGTVIWTDLFWPPPPATFFRYARLWGTAELFGGFTKLFGHCQGKVPPGYSGWGYSYPHALGSLLGGCRVHFFSKLKQELPSALCAVQICIEIFQFFLDGKKHCFIIVERFLRKCVAKQLLLAGGGCF